MATISLRDFVKKVEDKEGIVVRVWADPDTQVEDYTYSNCAADNTCITDFINTRIKPKLILENGKEIPFEIIEGNRTKPHGNTLMKTLRSTYTG